METTSKTFWQTACELKIGPVPAPVYLVLAVIVAAATIFGQLPADMVGGIAIMMVMGILLGDIGLKVPILKDIGGPAILSIFIPSAMVYYGLLNSDAIKAITAFTKGANFLYFYISCLVVGSILGMVRTVLVPGVPAHVRSARGRHGCCVDSRLHCRHALRRRSLSHVLLHRDSDPFGRRG